MAGNKALEKFKDSKIPKKGKAKTIIEIPIYKEPNTHSQIIGKIKKNQEITWISKSICDEREWIRCNENNNYGYIVGYEKDGKCNLEIGTIKEKKDDVKKEYGFIQKPEVIPITKEEIKLGNEALEEILNDTDDKKNKRNESKTNISTENDESIKSDLSKLDDGKSQTSEIKLEPEVWDNSYEEDIDNIDLIKFENDKLLNEIRCQIKKEESKNKSNSDSKNNNKNIDIDNSVLEAISSLEEGLPKDEKIKVEELLKDLEDLHLASQNKKDKKNENNETVEIDGKIYPKDYSSNVGDFNQALKDAKRLNNIPKNQNPIYKTDNYDRRGKWQEGSVYVYKDKDGKNIEFRDDRKGHKFEEGYELPPHINDPKGRHFFYNGKGDIHNVEYKKKEGK